MHFKAYQFFKKTFCCCKHHKISTHQIHNNKWPTGVIGHLICPSLSSLAHTSKWQVSGLSKVHISMYPWSVFSRIPTSPFKRMKNRPSLYEFSTVYEMSQNIIIWHKHMHVDMLIMFLIDRKYNNKYDVSIKYENNIQYFQ